MTIENILGSYRHIAVVGLSRNPERPSNSVARYMLEHGYSIYPVNPGVREVFGLPSHPSLSSMPPDISSRIEIVNIFRAPAEVPAIVDEAIAIGAKVIWMQFGASNEAAAQKAREAGLAVIGEHCIAVEHQRIFG
ncbi:MAG: CoA-binding protein [Chlorobiaceae bacterium]|nr:CoA-binding protein [Chlorobiaceae bacterium]